MVRDTRGVWGLIVAAHLFGVALRGACLAVYFWPTPPSPAVAFATELRRQTPDGSMASGERLRPGEQTAARIWLDACATQSPLYTAYMAGWIDCNASAPAGVLHPALLAC